MKKLILILAVVISFTLAGCSSNSYDYESSEEDYMTGNPYSSGSGHSAGYEWAESKGVSSCGGKSQSFIEGCEEYLRQAGY